MTVGQRVDIESGMDIFRGVITKVINKDACVVSWKYKKGKNEYKYNRLYLVNDVNKGRVRYDRKGLNDE